MYPRTSRPLHHRPASQARALTWKACLKRRCHMLRAMLDKGQRLAGVVRAKQLTTACMASITFWSRFQGLILSQEAYHVELPKGSDSPQKPTKHGTDPRLLRRVQRKCRSPGQSCQRHACGHPCCSCNAFVVSVAYNVKVVRRNIQE